MNEFEQARHRKFQADARRQAAIERPDAAVRNKAMQLGHNPITGEVVLVLGKETSTLSFFPDEAITLGKSLINLAHRLKKIPQKPALIDNDTGSITDV